MRVRLTALNNLYVDWAFMPPFYGDSHMSFVSQHRLVRLWNLPTRLLFEVAQLTSIFVEQRDELIQLD